MLQKHDSGDGLDGPEVPERHKCSVFSFYIQCRYPFRIVTGPGACLDATSRVIEIEGHILC